MQTYRFKTGCAFVLALITITAARPAAFAQQKQEIRKTIIITDGDTIINGKNLKNLSKSDREALRKELRATEQNLPMRRAKQKSEEIIIKNGDKAPKILRWSDKDEDGIFMGDHPWVLSDSLITFMKDSLHRQLRFNLEHMDSNMRQKMMELHRRMGSMPPMMGRVYPRSIPKEGELYNRTPSRSKNSQSFNYVNTDKDGITTHLNIRLTDVSEEVSKKISHDNKVLEVTDLVISPNFSAGKLNLSFQTATRGSISVKILDSDLKAAFTDQPVNFNGSYYKQVSLPKNGVYYIHISQNGKSFIKKMVKE